MAATTITRTGSNKTHSSSNNTKHNRADKLAQAHERLVEAVSSLTSGDDWRKMLAVAGRFHDYSPRNVWLILRQCPEASHVAGYRSWQSLGRHVKKGERGIAILAPCVVRPKDEQGKQTQNQQAAEKVDKADKSPAVVAGFRVVHVFDLSQTDGDELPEVAPAVLQGDAPAELWERLAAYLERTGFRLLRGDTGDANAVTHFRFRTVVVKRNLPRAQAVKSLAHEVAHTVLHDGTEYSRGCRGITEVEAESVAYLVCEAAGMATGEYTFPYVARWADGDLELVRKTAERVVTCARKLVADLGLFADGQTDREAP